MEKGFSVTGRAGGIQKPALFGQLSHDVITV
jgi:hypothetical protein